MAMSADEKRRRQRERARERRATDPEYVEKVRENYRRWFNRLSQPIRDAKDRPCQDCGTQLPPEVMELDHVRGEKVFGLAKWYAHKLPPGRTREEMIAEEIAKCEVRCPNCHRMRHYNEKTGQYLSSLARRS